jgi:hypothetical protein
MWGSQQPCGRWQSARLPKQIGCFAAEPVARPAALAVCSRWLHCRHWRGIVGRFPNLATPAQNSRLESRRHIETRSAREILVKLHRENDLRLLMRQQAVDHGSEL